MKDELFEKACNGDLDAASRLIDEQTVSYAKWLAFKGWPVFSSSVHEEIANEALERAYKNLVNGKTTAQAKFRTYLASIVWKVGSEFNEVERGLEIIPNYEQDEEDTLLGNIPDPKLPPDRQAAYKELLEKVESEVMPSLKTIIATTAKKTCIFERWWEAIVDEEWELESGGFDLPTGWGNSTAELCNCSAGTVSTTVKLIKAKLAETIKKLRWKDD